MAGSQEARADPACAVASPPINFEYFEDGKPDKKSKELTLCGFNPTPTRLIGVPTSGSYESGTKLTNVEAFLGIRYAEAKRFQVASLTHPVEEVSHKDHSDAKNFRSVCPQSHGLPQTDPTKKPGSVVIGNEDCLELNIWRTTNATGKAPVMFFIHGGAFFFGSGADGSFDVTASAQDGVGITRFHPNRGLYNGIGMMMAANKNTSAFPDGLVLVTINYRLGALGFMYNDALRTEATVKPVYGNFGISDQQIALQWVQNYISNFGGDPTKVTIFGESAGAMSVGLHIFNTDGAKQVGERPALFRAAIMESNPLGVPYRGNFPIPDRGKGAPKTSVDLVNLQSCTFMLRMLNTRVGAEVRKTAWYKGLKGPELIAVNLALDGLSKVSSCRDILETYDFRARLNAVMLKMFKDPEVVSAESIVDNQIDLGIALSNLAGKDTLGWYGLLPWTPFLGQAEDTTSPSRVASLAHGQPLLTGFNKDIASPIPFMLGMNRDEGVLFTGALGKLLLTRGAYL